MPRSTHALPALVVAVVAVVACTKTSDSQQIVTAPVASTPPPAGSTTASAPQAPVAEAPPPSSAPPLEGPGPDDSQEAPARFRSCSADADCVAVDHVGCCHNGWKVAVSASQKDAYAKSFTCPEPRPMCPMYIVRDTRVAKCDSGT